MCLQCRTLSTVPIQPADISDDVALTQGIADFTNRDKREQRRTLSKQFWQDRRPIELSLDPDDEVVLARTGVAPSGACRRPG